MEILKGFVWDIQRFAKTYTVNTTGAASTTNPFGTGTAGDDWFTADGTTWVKKENGNDAVSPAIARYTASDGTAGVGTLFVAPGDTVVNANNTALTVKVFTGMSLAAGADDSTAGVVTAGTQTAGTVIVGSGTTGTVTLANDSDITVTGNKLAAITKGSSFEFTSGTTTIGSTVAVTGVSIKSGASVVYDGKNSVTATEDGTFTTTTAGGLNLLTGTYTTDSTTSPLLVKGDVTINDNTFTNTSGSSTYTYNATKSAVALGASDVMAKKAGTESVEVTMASGTQAVFTADEKAAATFTDNATNAVTNFTVGEIKFTQGASANKVTMSHGAASSALTFTDADCTVEGGTTYLTITSLGAGSVLGQIGQDIKVGNTTFASYNSTALTIGSAGGATYGLVGGTVTATNSTGSINIMKASAAINSTGTTYSQGDIVSVNSGTVYVSPTAATGNAVVTGLDEVGEKVTIQDKTSSAGDGSVILEVVSSGVVMVTGGTNDGKYYNTDTNMQFTDLGGTSEVGASDLNTTLYQTAATTKFNSIGRTTTGTTDIAATLVVTGSGTSLSKTLTVTKKLSSVSMIGDTVKVVEKSTGTKYNLSSSSSVTANDTTAFTVTNGVVSDVTGTLTLDSTNKELVALGTVNVDMTSAATGKVTYNTGTSITDAKITFSSGETLVFSESNSGSDSVATVLDRNAKTLVGVDAGATITTTGLKGNNLELDSITTAGSGAFTINKQTYTVAGDEDGVTFTLSTAADDTISAIDGLTKEATITTGKLSDVDLSVNGTAFQDITAKEGVIFTATSTTASSITLQAKGDKVTDSTGKYVYELTTVGNASDGVVIGADNSLKALNDGDTLTVTDNSTGSAVVTTYTAANGMLKVANTSGTTMYTLSDSTDTGFEVASAVAASPNVTNGTKGETISGAGTYTFGSDSDPATGVNSLVDGMYVTSDGSTSLSNTKAVAQISLSDDTVTYTALGDKGQRVVVGADTTDKQNWIINTLGGKDTITYTADADATISSGNGNDEIFVAGKGEKTINVGDGKKEITIRAANTGDATINGGSGNSTITASGTGDYIINANGGNNVIDRSGATGGNATIVGGTGKDTITAYNTDDVISGGDGADTFNVSTRSMKVSDYVYGTDVLQSASVAGAVTVTPANFGGDGIVTIASGVTADVSAGTGTGDFWAVSMVDSDGKNKQNVAWAKDGGSTIDISTYDQAVTLIGNADGKNALYAGTKADNIYSYAENDSVYGGEGKDTISLATGATGRVVGVATTSGKDTVSGFKASFEEGDSIFMVDGAASDVKASFANNTVTFKDGEGSLQLNNVTTNSTTGAVELNVSGAKVALAAASVGGAIAADSTSYANFYMGNGAGVSFAAAEGEVNVDLRNGLDSGAEGAKFSGITAVTGGAGNNTLIGGTAAESIYAGTGASSLWGGAGKDSLIGSTASDAFFIGAGDGSDVVTNFSAAGNENADTVYALNDITGAKLTSNGVEISVSDTDKLTLKNVTADTAIKFNSNGNAGVAKVGSATTANNFSYDSTVTYYGGGSKSDKIAFASGSTDNAEIWLDGSQGKAYASIDVVDGTNTSGNLIVAGDSSSQSIIGGKGDSSLWGGASSASDTLRSSSNGSTVFFYGTGEGNDVVVSASANDSVNLYNLKLSDVDVANSSITNSGVSLALNDGSKLTVQTSRDMTFSIDGQSWTAQHSSKEWKQNS